MTIETKKETLGCPQERSRYWETKLPQQWWGLDSLRVLAVVLVAEPSK